MDYGHFLRLRRAAWDRFEAALNDAQRDPRSISHDGLEDIALQYRQVLHDQALAAVRFPGTGAARRLHKLGLAGQRWLSRGREVGGRGLLRGFLYFWTHRFPRAFRRCLPHFGLATGLFLLAAVFALLLTAIRPEVASAFLPPEAIEDLARGRLWTESIEDMSPALVGAAIAGNNIKVALIGWIGGLFAGLGSIYVLLLNGFLLGSVIAATEHYSMSGSILEFVSAHGPLEISLILLTSGAGLRVGAAMVRAHDRPRAEVLREAGADALVLFGGAVPWLLLLGTVEATVSPASNLDPTFKVGLGLTLEALFLTLAWNPLLREPAPGPLPELREITS